MGTTTRKMGTTTLGDLIKGAQNFSQHRRIPLIPRDGWRSTRQVGDRGPTEVEFCFSHPDPSCQPVHSIPSL